MVRVGGEIPMVGKAAEPTTYRLAWSWLRRSGVSTAALASTPIRAVPPTWIWPIRLRPTWSELLATPSGAKDHDLQVVAGAAIVLFTDGVTEANDPEGTMFGEASLEASLAALGQSPPAQGVAAIQQTVQVFARDVEQVDDITVLALRWHGPVATPAAMTAKRLSVQPEI
jgi:hypothetical protein